MRVECHNNACIGCGPPFHLMTRLNLAGSCANLCNRVAFIEQ
jgi:hypothetical protein